MAVRLQGTRCCCSSVGSVIDRLAIRTCPIERAAGFGGDSFGHAGGGGEGFEHGEGGVELAQSCGHCRQAKWWRRRRPMSVGSLGGRAAHSRTSAPTVGDEAQGGADEFVDGFVGCFASDFVVSRAFSALS
jgi:hypothetical protein